MTSYYPIVSIIIPVYNGVDYMQEAIDSALAQTYENVEIIVVNDGSTDETDKIAKSYGNKIKYFTKENAGVATALNLGIKQANGEFISWLSHDDTYYPNKIDVQINELNALNADERDNTIIFSYFDTFKLEENKKYFGIPTLENYSTEDPLYTYSMLDAFFSSKIGGCTLLFPKKIFEKVGYFEEKYLTIQDYVLFIKMFKVGIKFHYVNQNLVTSRHHKNQGTIKLDSKHVQELNYLYKWAFDEFKHEFQKMPFWQFNHFLEIIRIRTLDKVYAYMCSEWVNGDQNRKLQIENQALQTENQALQTENQALQTENQTLRDWRQALLTENQTLRDWRQALLTENQSLQDQLATMNASHSWRITKPLRMIANFIRISFRGES